MNFPVQAFPSSREYALSETIIKQEEDGMELRDYFAAKALSSLAPTFIQSQPGGLIAEQCYALADALMAERQVVSVPETNAEAQLADTVRALLDCREETTRTYEDAYDFTFKSGRHRECWDKLVELTGWVFNPDGVSE